MYTDEYSDVMTRLYGGSVAGWKAKLFWECSPVESERAHIGGMGMMESYDVNLDKHNQ